MKQCVVCLYSFLKTFRMILCDKNYAGYLSVNFNFPLVINNVSWVHCMARFYGMWPNFWKWNFPQNNFDQTLTFNHLPFGHFVQQVNEIWYPGRAIIVLLRYWILLTFFAKWKNGDSLNVSIWSKLFCKKSSYFKI